MHLERYYGAKLFSLKTKKIYSKNYNSRDTRAFLVLGKDVDTSYSAGLTPLFNASSYGQFTNSRILVCCGANVNIYHNFLLSPLHVSIFRGHSKIVRILLICGINTIEDAYDRYTLLHLACQTSRLEIVQDLVVVYF